MNQDLRQTFNDFLTTQLNAQQQKAVVQKQGGFLVIAGAGSGKTRIITSRIANLILNEDVQPRSIIALTFTNKAAGEMKERLQRFFQGHYALPFVGTFHSYCLLLLRSNPTLLPYAQFSILDSDDQLALINRIVKQHNLGKFATASQLCAQISNVKNKAFMGMSIEEFATPMLREVYATYEEEKAQAHCFDFDDLILQVLTLFKKNDEFRTKFQQKVRHILVDEYQDTSHVQHQLLKYMGLDTSNKFAVDSLCAVGDEDQSIYSWRGATVTNMLKFENDFAPVTMIKVEQNYRSVEPILKVANSVIANNRLRNPKNLWSDRQAKNRIIVLKCRSSEQEAEAIALFLKSLPSSTTRSEVAILYRTHFQSRSIEEALIHHAIPYKIIGGIRFYERKEIKDLLGYLRLITNPYDKISLLRVINCPTRGLGKKFEEDLINTWQQQRFLDFKQLLPLMTEQETGVKRAAIQEFISFFEDLDKDMLPNQALQHIINRTEYLNYLRTSFDAKEAETKIENVKELLQSVCLYESTRKEPGQATLENFLHEVTLLQEQIHDEEDGDQVQMMTLHAAKGLEFKIVLLSGLDEGILPSSRSLNAPDALEEERRLFYVGITRAEEYLLMFCANYRNTFGQIVDQVPSRFVSEMPNGLVMHADIEKMYPSQMTPFFTRLLGGVPVESSLVTFNQTTSQLNHSKSSSHRIGTSPVRHSLGDGVSNSIQNHTKNYGTPRSASNLQPYGLGSRPSAKPAPRSSIMGSRPTGKAQSNKSSESSTPISMASSSFSGGGWAKNQTVQHAKFGTGIVVLVEKADGDEYYITALFRAGKKKILSSFLTKD